MINEQGVVAAASAKASGLVGNWYLLQYYQDNGTGSGQWITPDFVETLTFGSEGEFSATMTFPLFGYGYTSFLVKDNSIVFFPSKTNDNAYQYVLESPTQLLFFPRCRETCTRRYVLR
jgi:hypothetical protein